jgi:CheY-like chemotaxis protein
MMGQGPIKCVVVDDCVPIQDLFRERLSTQSVILLDPNERTIDEITECLKHELSKEEPSVIFINIDLRCRDRLRVDQAGIEILKLLRTRAPNAGYADGCDCHCVLYSFRSLEDILRQKPQNLMAVSPGTTLLQLPFDAEALPDPVQLSHLEERKADARNLPVYIRGEFTLPDDRHNWANWWGIKRLYDVHYALFPDAARNGRYPDAVEKRLKDLKTIQAMALYDFKEDDLNAAVRSCAPIARTLMAIMRERPLRVIHIDDRAQDGWSQVLAEILLGAATAQRRDAFTEWRDSSGADGVLLSLDLSKSPCNGGNLRAWAKEITDTLVHAYYVKSSEFYGDTDGFDIILLDLRLQAQETGVSHIVDKLSGSILLQKLRELLPTVPVIMTTASNKVWSWEAMLKLGADGYWVKEGLDERRDAAASCLNYIRLLELVTKATGEKYQFLRRFGSSVLELDGAGPYWWEEKHTWPGGEVTRGASKADIMQILRATTALLRVCLRETEMGYGPSFPGSEAFWYSAIINKAANVIEQVHLRAGESHVASETLLGRWDEKLGRWTSGRRDFLGAALWAIRNVASHAARGNQATMKHLQTFLAGLRVWLTFDPTTRAGPVWGPGRTWSDTTKYLKKAMNTDDKNLFSDILALQ